MIDDLVLEQMAEEFLASEYRLKLTFIAFLGLRGYPL